MRKTWKRSWLHIWILNCILSLLLQQQYMNLHNDELEHGLNHSIQIHNSRFRIYCDNYIQLHYNSILVNYNIIIIHYQSNTSYYQHSMCFRKVSIEYKCHLSICLFDKSLWYCSNDRLVTNIDFHIDSYISILYLETILIIGTIKIVNIINILNMSRIGLWKDDVFSMFQQNVDFVIWIQFSFIIQGIGCDTTLFGISGLFAFISNGIIVSVRSCDLLHDIIVDFEDESIKLFDSVCFPFIGNNIVSKSKWMQYSNLFTC